MPVPPAETTAEPSEGAPAAATPREAVIVTEATSRVASTVPFWSVRKTRAEWVRRRDIVAEFGWPYVFLAPTETAATRGRSVASSTSEDAVALP